MNKGVPCGSSRLLVQNKTFRPILHNPTSGIQRAAVEERAGQWLKKLSAVGGKRGRCHIVGYRVNATKVFASTVASLLCVWITHI